MVSENTASQHGGNHQPGIKPDEVDHRHGDGGIMMANVPQDVPVEKAIKQDTRNNTAGRCLWEEWIWLPGPQKALCPEPHMCPLWQRRGSSGWPEGNLNDISSSALLCPKTISVSGIIPYSSLAFIMALIHSDFV